MSLLTQYAAAPFLLCGFESHWGDGQKCLSFVKCVCVCVCVCVCCYEGLITRLEESYRVLYVCVCSRNLNNEEAWAH